jgi:hypothetical protein
VRGGVAEVHGHRVAAVTLLDVGEALGGQVERLVPADLREAVADLLERVAQPVGVVLQLGEGHALRADVAAAERILLVAADLEHPLAVVLDLEPAERLAEHALGVVGARGHRGPPRAGGVDCRPARRLGKGPDSAVREGPSGWSDQAPRRAKSALASRRRGRGASRPWRQPRTRAARRDRSSMTGPRASGRRFLSSAVHDCPRGTWQVGGRPARWVSSSSGPRCIATSFAPIGISAAGTSGRTRSSPWSDRLCVRGK